MSLETWRNRAGWVIVGGVVFASVISFVLSYRGLWEWADRHGDWGGWQWVFPGCIDTFIIVGEAVLFWAIVDRWDWKARVPAWCAVGLGLAASVAGNVGHVGWQAPVTDRATAAVPPLAATGILALGLAVLKRVAQKQSAGKQTAGKQAAAEPREAKARREIVKTKAARIDLEASRALDVPGCPHAEIPLGEGRVSVAIEHFRDCLHQHPGQHPMAAWTGVPRSTLKRRLNGSLETAVTGS